MEYKLKRVGFMVLKKSQIAMESVLIYGLVILVVSLAIGALVYFGVLDLSKFLPDSCNVAGEGLICENFVVKVRPGTGQSGVDENVQLEIRNKVGKNIEGLKAKIIGEEDMANAWGSSCATASGESVENGGLKLLQMGCTLTISSGKKIKGRLDLEYKVVGSAITRTASGTIYTTVAS
ncbi:hypothetical protein HYY70_04635 [Candidatus Woesearchaeota archaeon]|nr:hypothetical protein [Candidatus Woesearchaeota archaeon]